MSPRSKKCRTCQTVEADSFRHVIKSGYVIVRSRDHPNSFATGSNAGMIYEHILVMSQVLDRPLVKGENVHHRNGDRSDNRPENLELWVRRQPSGQRVADRVTDAVDVLRRYAPDLLR